ncbi:MAG: restriction endonuclease [Candidatus Bathyarchaeia archaeon]
MMLVDKRKKRYKRMGWRLELLIIEALKELGFNDIIWNQKDGGADVIIPIAPDRTIEIEAKRHRKTRYVNRSWLKEHVFSRFTKKAALRVLVCTKVNWSPRDDILFMQEGVSWIDAGCIDRQYQLEKAKETFKEQFARVIYERWNVLEPVISCPKV